eukprot:4988135-Amphidinium_carterae.1
MHVKALQTGTALIVRMKGGGGRWELRGHEGCIKEELWELWNGAATRALEVRPQGRGRLTLESKTLRPPKADRETQQEAFRQHYEASLLRMARTGQAVLAHAWPSWIDTFPPTALAQQELLEGRNSARKPKACRRAETSQGHHREWPLHGAF